MKRTKSKYKPKLNSIHTLEIFKKALSSSSLSQNRDTKIKKELLSLIDISIDLIEKHPDPVLFDKNIYENLRICIETIPNVFHSFKIFLQEKHLLSQNNTFSMLSVLTRLEHEMKTGTKKRFNVSQKKPSGINQKQSGNTVSRRRGYIKPFLGGSNNLLGSISSFFRRNINNNAQVHLQQVEEFTDTNRVIENSLIPNNNEGPGAYHRPGTRTGTRPIAHAVGTRHYRDPEPGTLPGYLMQVLQYDGTIPLITEFEILDDESEQPEIPLPNTDNRDPPLITHLSNQDLKSIISNIIDRWCHWDIALETSFLLFVGIIGITSFIGGIFVTGGGLAVVPIYYLIITGLLASACFKSGFNVFQFTKNKEKCKVRTLNMFLNVNQVSLQDWNNGNVNIESWIHDPERISRFPSIWKEIQRQNPIISEGDNINTAVLIPDDIDSAVVPSIPRSRLQTRTRTRTRNRTRNTWDHHPSRERIRLTRPGTRRVVPTIIEEDNEED